MDRELSAMGVETCGLMAMGLETRELSDGAMAARCCSAAYRLLFCAAARPASPSMTATAKTDRLAILGK